MGSEWQFKPLGEICELVDYGFTASATDERLNYNFLRITDIQGGTVDWEGVPYCEISESEAQKYKLRKGDIVIARTGNSTGENYIFDKNLDAVFASYLIRFRVSENHDPKFIWYQLRTKAWWDFVTGSKTGSAQAGANANVLKRFEVSLPPLPIQRQIAAILSAFDDKIELNRRMNRTLEQMARALFKSWFVDFDPVRAKMRGEQPQGMDAETAALFPDELVEVEGREVPRGWRVGRIGDIAFQGKEQMNPNAFPDALFAHFSIPAFDSGQSPTLEPGSNIKSNKFIVPDGAILVSKLNPATPRIWNVDKPEGADFNVCSTEFIPLVPENSEVAALLYAALTGDAFRYTLADQASGTSNSHQRVKPADIINAPLILPDEEVLAAFGNLSIPILEHMKYNIRESAQLAAIRDALLPRLLAGEIDVSGWEGEQ